MKVRLVLWGHLVLLLVGNVKSSCTMDLDGPKTAEELHAVLDKATDGSVIQLLPIEYIGDFVLNTKHSEAKVALKGSEGCDKRSTIIGSWSALTVNNGRWTISNLDIESGLSGIMLKGPDNTLEYIQIKNVLNGIGITGDRNTVRNCTVAATQDGILIRASHSAISDLSLQAGTGKGIEIKSGSKNFLEDVSITGVPNAGSTAVVLDKMASNNHLESISLDNGFVKINGDSNLIIDVNGLLATVIVEGSDNSIRDMNVKSVIITGDSNTLLDFNVKDSVILKGNTNTLRHVSYKNPVKNSGQNNMLYDMSFADS